ncbi:hypothetical protein QAD02_006702 [Eretmocerus hayati]|uniref:Uncharacterized protein n=1 Tax=Eretmocerus hayati TaxID=131215 RepID=A0ACC2N5X0_9HYME|nr:hypothetical protein QAD02_006702 [Eretmocerus hayati]
MDWLIERVNIYAMVSRIVKQKELHKENSMDPPQATGKLIGERLFINGYIYTKSQVDERGRSHWKCVRYCKEIEAEKCTSKAMTIDSPKAKQIVLRGPDKSKHNHSPSREELEEAMNLAKKNWNPKSIQRTGPSLKDAIAKIQQCSTTQYANSFRPPGRIRGRLNHRPKPNDKYRIGSDHVLKGLKQPILTTLNHSIIPQEARLKSQEQVKAKSHRPNNENNNRCPERESTQNTTKKPDAKNESVTVAAKDSTEPALQSTAKLIGNKLCISGFVYYGCSAGDLTRREKTYWKCARNNYKKQSKYERCSARAVTCYSPNGSLKVLKGPKESKHNHHQPSKTELDGILARWARRKRKSKKKQLDRLHLDQTRSNCVEQITQDKNFSALIENESSSSSEQGTITSLDRSNDQNDLSESCRTETRQPNSEDNTVTDCTCPGSGATNHRKMVVRQIGKRLYIDGYMYGKVTKTNKGTDWICRRFHNTNVTPKCEATARTIVRSPIEISFISGGPLESKHNHPPMTEEVEDAELLARFCGGENFTYQFVSRADSSMEIQDIIRKPCLQDKNEIGSNSEATDFSCNLESLRYRRFLIEFSEKPIFGKNSIIRALNASHDSRYNLQTAYDIIMKNREKIMKDLKNLKNDPRICSIRTRDGNYSLYEPGDAPAVEFCEKQQNQLTSNTHNDTQPLKEQENVISSTQEEGVGEDARHFKVSLSIKDIVNYWPPIPEPDSVADDTSAVVKIENDVSFHCVEVKKENDHVGDDYESNTRDSFEPSSEESGVSIAVNQSSNGSSTTLAMSKAQQQNTTDTERPIPNKSPHFPQNVERTDTTDKMSPQPILAESTSSQLDSPSTKPPITKSSLCQPQNILEPSPVNQTDPQTIWISSGSPQSSPSDFVEKIATSSQDRPLFTINLIFSQSLTYGTGTTQSTLSNVEGPIISNSKDHDQSTPKPCVESQAESRAFQSHSSDVNNSDTASSHDHRRNFITVKRQNEIEPPTISTTLHSLQSSCSKIKDKYPVRSVSCPLITSDHNDMCQMTPELHLARSKHLQLESSALHSPITSTSYNPSETIALSTSMNQTDPQAISTVTNSINLDSADVTRPIIISLHADHKNSSRSNVDGLMDASLQKDLVKPTKPSAKPNVFDQIVQEPKSSLSNFYGIENLTATSCHRNVERPVTVDQNPLQENCLGRRSVQSELVEVESQNPTSSQCHLGTMAKSATIDDSSSRTGLQHISNVPKAPQSNFRDVRSLTSESSPGHLQSLDQPNSMNQTDPQLSFADSTLSRSDSAGNQNQTPKSPLDHLQNIVGRTSFTQIPPESNFNEPMSTPRNARFQNLMNSQWYQSIARPSITHEIGKQRRKSKSKSSKSSTVARQTVSNSQYYPGNLTSSATNRIAPELMLASSGPYRFNWTDMERSIVSRLNDIYRNTSLAPQVSPYIQQPVMTAARPSQYNWPDVERQIHTYPQGYSRTGFQSTLTATRQFRYSWPDVERQIHKYPQGCYQTALQSTLAVTQPSQHGFFGASRPVFPSSHALSQSIPNLNTSNQFVPSPIPAVPEQPQFNFSGIQRPLVPSSQSYTESLSRSTGISQIGLQSNLAASQPLQTNFFDVARSTTLISQEPPHHFSKSTPTDHVNSQLMNMGNSSNSLNCPPNLNWFNSSVPGIPTPNMPTLLSSMQIPPRQYPAECNTSLIISADEQRNCPIVDSSRTYELGKWT